MSACLVCMGEGFVPEHDPSNCPGGGPLCEQYCPVQMPCPECAPSGRTEMRARFDWLVLYTEALERRVQDSLGSEGIDACVKEANDRHKEPF